MGKIVRSITLLLAVFLGLSLVSVGNADAATWYQPGTGNIEWQWEIGHPLDVNNSRDMGLNVQQYNGSIAANPTVYDIDGFDNPASTVSYLHSKGFHVVCYIEVGAAEDYRSDYSQFPADSLGNVMPGYSDERYVDIRNPAVLQIIENRISMCASKNFGSVETDIDESYNSPTGFPLTQADEETYMTTLANYMHSLSMGWWIKNPDDTGDSYAADMYNYADAVLTESCNEYSSCSLLNAYKGHKAIFNAEYDLNTSQFCPADNTRGFNGEKFLVTLGGYRKPCR